jgi:hypothetical protein
VVLAAWQRRWQGGSGAAAVAAAMAAARRRRQHTGGGWLGGCSSSFAALQLSLRTNAKDCCGIVSDHFTVEWETSRAYKFGTMVGFVLDSFSEDGCEGLNSSQLVVEDDHEQWEKGFPNG